MALGIAVFFHSPFRLIELLVWKSLTASSTCLVRGSTKYPVAFILNCTLDPLCLSTQCDHNTESLFLRPSALKCSSPLQNIVLLVSPWYCASQAWQVMLYPTFLLLQSPPFSALHGKQFCLPQDFPLHGLDLQVCDRRVLPPSPRFSLSNPCHLHS